MKNDFFKNLAESAYQKAADGIVSVKSTEDETKLRKALEIETLIDDQNVSADSIDITTGLKKDTSLPVTTTVSEGYSEAAAIAADELYDLADEIVDLIDSFAINNSISHSTLVEARSKMMQVRDTLLIGSPADDAVPCTSVSESVTDPDAELKGILNILKKSKGKK